MKKTSNFHHDLVKHQASGGFKFPLDTLTKHSLTKNETKKNINKTVKITNINETLPLKSELLSQIGLDPNVKDNEIPIDFDELKEEGLYGLNSRKELGDYVIKDIEKKIEKMKMSRQEMEKKVFEKRQMKESAANEDVIIYEGDQRKQYVSHILSTLDVKTVENVEALIEAHQHELLSLESQYLSHRKSHLLSHKNLKGGPTRNFWGSNSKYRNKTFKSAADFQPQKPMTKEEYYKSYQQYLKEKTIKKNSKIHSQAKTPQTAKQFQFDPDFDRYQPTSPNPKRSKSPPKSKRKRSAKKNKNLENPESPTKLEKPLIKYFFQKIPKHESHTNPSKNEILKFLIKNPKILELYSLNPETLNQELTNFSHSNFLNFQDFSEFLKKMRMETTEKPIENTCLLDNKDVVIMNELFKEVDFNQDGVVKRTYLTEKIRNDRRLAKKLEFQALYLPTIDKVLTLNQVLKQVEQEAIMAKGTKDYISWEEFERYLREHKIKEDPALLSKIRILKAKTLVSKTEGDENVLDLDKFLKQTLKDIFDMTKKKIDSKGHITGFVKALDLMENIRGHPDFWKYEREIVRKKSENHSLKQENLGELLIRIEDEGPKYIVWNEFLDYFTRKGKPGFLAKKEKEETQKYEEIFMPPNIEDYDEEYQTKAIKNLESLSPRHSIDSPYNITKKRKNKY